ncbi:MAG TPA: helix-turn-helix domain-containing protein [Burkholderiales bacterium]|nr:helix-turn-helix domain-containing protein [Burkholderiales bacterium]
MATPTALHDVTAFPCNTQLGCAVCSLDDLCLLSRAEENELGKFGDLIRHRRPVKRGCYVFHAGTPLSCIFAVKAGSFKTSVLHDDGREQVMGFYMAGEIMGLDGISSDFHTVNAVALEDSELCELPFYELERLVRDIPSLQRHFHRIMSREIVRDHGVMLLLGAMSAEERVATFLLQLSKRYLTRGYSASNFCLRMTRGEIGSYLGLTIETVSRVFSRLQDEELITADKRDIYLKDIPGLRKLIGKNDASMRKPARRAARHDARGGTLHAVA